MASKPPPGETFLNLYQFLVAQGEGGGNDGERARREFRATAAAPAAGVRCIVAGRWCLVDSGAKCLACTENILWSDPH